MAHQIDDFELAVDLPTPMSQVSINSNDSLKPAPLNFSRPRLRGLPSQASNYEHDSKRDSGHSETSFNAAPPPNVPRVTGPSDFDFSDLETYDGETEDDYEESAPPPVVRTHSNTAESGYYNYRTPSNNPRTGGPSKTWVYKPYADHASDADTSSVLTDIPESVDDEEEQDDASSVAESVATGHSSVSDFAYNGRLGWTPRSQSQIERERQRWQGTTSRLPQGPSRPYTRTDSKESNTSGGSASTGTGVRSVHDLQHFGSQESVRVFDNSNGRPLVPTRSNGSAQTSSSTESKKSTKSNPPTPPPRIPRIIKRTSFDQISEHVNIGDGMSDTASISSSEWKSSDFDTSDLTVEQIHKLKKKGINPALYAEMQQAKNRNGKGKKLRIGALTGNTFLG